MFYKLKFKKKFIKEIQFSDKFYVPDIFLKLQFLKNLKHFLLKLCPFLSADFRVLLRDMNLT